MIRLVARPSLHLLVAGGVVGSVAGMLIANTLHAEIGGLAPFVFADILPAAAARAVVVVAAAWLPARRATSIEPASALKQP